jgi:hypothetical protein
MVCTGCNVCRPSETCAELAEYALSGVRARSGLAYALGARKISAALVDSEFAVWIVAGMQITRLIQSRGLIVGQVQVRSSQVGVQLLGRTSAQDR